MIICIMSVLLQEVEMDPTRLSAEGLTPKQSGGSPAHSARMSARSARSGRSTRSARTPSPLLHSRKSDGSPRLVLWRSRMQGRVYLFVLFCSGLVFVVDECLLEKEAKFSIYCFVVFLLVINAFHVISLIQL